MATYSRIVLAERPETDIEDKTFKMEKVPMPDKSSLKEDQVLVKVQHLSLDPGRPISNNIAVQSNFKLSFSLHHLTAMRGWLRDTRSYLPPVQIGEVMRAGGLGEVAAIGPSVKSLKVGDKVEGIVGAFCN